MQPYLINYLKKNQGKNLERIIPDLEKVSDKNRIDGHRFDMLAFSASSNKLYALKDLYSPTGYDMDKIVKDSEWFAKFGVPLMLIPAEMRELAHSFPDTIETRLYFFDKRDYHFVESASGLKSEWDLYKEIAIKMATDPQMIKNVLKVAKVNSRPVNFLTSTYSILRRMMK